MRHIERLVVESRVFERDAAEHVERLHKVDVARSEDLALALLVDHLCDADDLFGAADDRNAENRLRPITGRKVDVFVETRVFVRVGDVEELPCRRNVAGDAVCDR